MELSMRIYEPEWWWKTAPYRDAVMKKKQSPSLVHIQTVVETLVVAENAFHWSQC